MSWNTTDTSLPPFTEGVVPLTEEEILFVQREIEVCRQEFVPDRFHPEPTKDILISMFNDKYYSQGMLLNGDTYDMCMAYQPQTVEEGSAV